MQILNMACWQNVKDGFINLTSGILMDVHWITPNPQVHSSVSHNMDTFCQVYQDFT